MKNMQLCYDKTVLYTIQQDYNEQHLILKRGERRFSIEDRVVKEDNAALPTGVRRIPCRRKVMRNAIERSQTHTKIDYLESKET